MYKILTLLSFSIVLFGCQNLPVAIPEVTKPIKDKEKQINLIKVGMNKQQVIDILGEPRTTEAEYATECLLYPLTSYSSSRDKYAVVFHKNKLIKYNYAQCCIEIFKEMKQEGKLE